MRVFLSSVFTLLVCQFFGLNALAQLQTPDPVVDWQKHVTDTQRLKALGNDLMGDQIDFNTGSVSFEHTDVSLPGNNGLAVAIKRRLTRGILYDISEASEFGDWEIVVPRMTATTAQATNFRTGARCSANNPFQAIHLEQKLPSGTTYPNPGTNPNTQGYEYSQGIQIDTAEYGSEKVMRSGLTAPLGPYTAATKYITRSNFKISCLSNISGGGEGFLAVSPEGITYRFDRFYERHTQDQILSNYVDSDAKRYKSIIAATEVTDVHGNWVKYEYDVYNRLIRIYSNDGREITLSYTGIYSPISQISANGRTWTYTYSTRSQVYEYVEWGLGNGQSGQQFYSLTNVTLPDGRSWIIGSLDMHKTSELDGCTPFSAPTIWDSNVIIKHPSGAWGKFKFDTIRRRVGSNLLQTKSTYGSTNLNTPYPNGTAVTLACPSLSSINKHIEPEGGAGGILVHTPVPPDEDNFGGIIYSNYAPQRPANLLMYRDMQALVKKEISGPSIATATWEMDYSEIPFVHYSNPNTVPAVPASQHTNWTKVVEPDGAETTYFYHWDAETYGGELKRKETRQAPSAPSILQAMDYSYAIPAFSIGIPGFLSIYPPAKQKSPVVQTKAVTAQDGETFTSETAYNLDLLHVAYSFGKPIQTKAYSSVAVGQKITDIEYFHDTAKWILGLPEQITQDGRDMISAQYDAFGQITQYDKFGDRALRLAYDTDGTLATLTDELDRVTSLSSYKRGLAQTMVRAVGSIDEITLSRTVDDNGWITSQTDARGNTVNIDYNAMGWTTDITPPAPWSATNISYTGLGANLVQTNTKGTAQEKIFYDAMHRPIKTVTSPLSGGATSIVEIEYDALGRTVFTSLPSAASGSTIGIETEYDALGRAVETKETTAPFATTTTEYLSGGRTKVTDPSGAVTITTVDAWGAPDQALPVLIEQPLGVDTEMSYDNWGNMLTLRQHGVQNGHSADFTRTFTYDARNRLCRHSAPEFGDEGFLYDSLDRMSAMARGLASGAGCPTSLPAADKVSYTYDDLDRQEFIDFPSGTTDISKTYDDNSNVKSVTRGITTWQYDYHPTADLLTQETLNIDGLNFAYSYTYTPDGLIETRANPTGTIIDFMPNGLGQATGIKVGSTNYASGGVYYPNGALQTLNYLNGQSFSAGQNARQLLSSLDVTNGTAVAIDNDYLYDARAKITSITDGINAANNRAFTYDALGRLETANGSWGSGSYQYDAVNNIRLKTLGSRTVNIDYSPTTNLVSQVKDTANGNTWKTYTHDARGNVTSNGDINFVYDHANQPQSISGAASGAYIYDGNLKRVKQDVDPGSGAGAGSKKIYSVYSSLGGGISHRYEVGVDPVTLLPDPANDVRTDFVSLGGTTLRLQKTGSGNTVPVYTHSDHQGSPVAATDNSGAILWREAYTPFGEKLIDPAANRDLSGYTGHIADDATNLVYMQARYYDPTIGRFLSIDPVTFMDTGNPAMFNRYAYAFNDPINLIDPDGRNPRSDLHHEDIQPRVDESVSRTTNQDGSVTSSRTTTVSTPQRTSSGDTGTVTALPQDSANGAPANVPEDMESRLFDLSNSVDETVEVTSGVRTPEQNAAVGGAPGSSHLVDSAVDIRIPGNTPAQTADAAHDSGRFNRVNEYTNGRGVHVDTRATGNQGRFRDWVHQPDP